MPPFTMATKKGEFVGFDVDIARSMAYRMGVKLKLAIMPFSELLGALEKGKVDMVLSNMTITPRGIGPIKDLGRSLVYRG
jgi:ABC-type amino acid transport substrate-binding protein